MKQGWRYRAEAVLELTLVALLDLGLSHCARCLRKLFSADDVMARKGGVNFATSGVDDQLIVVSLSDVATSWR